MAQIGDSIQVSLPAGPISTSDILLRTSRDPAVQTTFNETCHYFGVTAALPYQVVLNIGRKEPPVDSIAVRIKLPDYFTRKRQADFGFQLFILVNQDVCNEAVDHFVIGPSLFNAADNTITTNLPAGFFSNARHADGTYEAVMMVGITPGANTATPDRFIVSCAAAQIGCPLGDLSKCQTTTTCDSRFRILPEISVARYHYGVDYNVPIGTPVFSVAAGEVIASKEERGYNGGLYGFGEYIAIKHIDGSISVYGQLSARTVQAGDRVTLGQRIGTLGSTSSSPFQHLHFEYYANSRIYKSQGQIYSSSCIVGNINGSITVHDNGNVPDDVFELYLDGRPVGSTVGGPFNTNALNNLRPGEKVLKLVCKTAADNIGTFNLLLENGVQFSDGSTYLSRTLPQGGSASWKISIPEVESPTLAKRKAQLNAVLEKPVLKSGLFAPP